MRCGQAEGDTGLVGLRRHHRAPGPHHLEQRHRITGAHRVRRVVHPGERQQVVDQGQQPAAVGLHPRHGATLVARELAELAVPEHLEVAHDAGHGRAQLVADGGDEGVLQRVDLLHPGQGALRGPLGLQLLGDVLRGADPAGDRAPVVDDLGQGGQVHALLVVAAPVRQQGAVVGAVHEGAEHGGVLGGDPDLRGLHPDRLVRVQEVAGTAQDVLGAVTQQALGAGVEQGDPALLVGADDRDPPGGVDHAGQLVALAGGLPVGGASQAHHQHQRDHHERAAHDVELQQHRDDLGRRPRRQPRDGAAAERVEGARDAGDDEHLGQGLPGPQPQRAPHQQRHHEEPERRDVVDHEHHRGDQQHRQPGQHLLATLGAGWLDPRCEEERQHDQLRGQVRGPDCQRHQGRVAEPGRCRRGQRHQGGGGRPEHGGGGVPVEVGEAVQPGSLAAAGGEDQPDDGDLGGDPECRGRGGVDRPTAGPGPEERDDRERRQPRPGPAPGQQQDARGDADRPQVAAVQACGRGEDRAPADDTDEEQEAGCPPVPHDPPGRSARGDPCPEAPILAPGRDPRARTVRIGPDPRTVVRTPPRAGVPPRWCRRARCAAGPCRRAR
ncbi:hypothetical protein ENKNEFLB_03457 [Nocardioides aquaticus]|uniref:Uncharacterized protein n=1 Tax=Nocardioides aquaticus TaxID=160826 RepID=A0ABX8EKN9_9ACTN|nr:hypothetical protein ENKNEFLB_03457 [Nocardioides aquaticus]